MKIKVYRITHTNPDGVVTELSYPQMQEFCSRVGLQLSHLFFYGKVKDFVDADMLDTVGDWQGYFVQELEKQFNEKDCFMCVNKVPEEGVVVRKESLFSFDAYKLKSFRFLEHETAQLDKGESDLESEN